MWHLSFLFLCFSAPSLCLNLSPSVIAPIPFPCQYTPLSHCYYCPYCISPSPWLCHATSIPFQPRVTTLHCLYCTPLTTHLLSVFLSVVYKPFVTQSVVSVIISTIVTTPVLPSEIPNSGPQWIYSLSSLWLHSSPKSMNRTWTRT
jgi:hypothetical protein